MGFAVSLLPATTKLSVEPSQTPMPPPSLLTSREAAPSCAEDHLLPLDTSSPLLTANTTFHPVLQSPSEMSLLPEPNLLNKCSTLSNKSHMNNTVHPTNKTTSWSSFSPELPTLTPTSPSSNFHQQT